MVVRNYIEIEQFIKTKHGVKIMYKKDIKQLFLVKRINVQHK
jgi:hypothetical protein